ncbi:MAG: YegS/Rv2252/BmrU family lipid kinase [Clostridiales bacterium]|nr:YegS/Rv2252/BmrU family lipid kinase [Clostridiales bacterium]
MKKAHLIYNPLAGNNTFMQQLDGCVEVLQQAGYETSFFRLASGMDLFDSSLKDYDLIICAGGDGTLSKVVNFMMRQSADPGSTPPLPPLGIIPVGTANDFANCIKMPSDPIDACKAVVSGEIVSIDVGLAGDSYFINVCGAGLFMNVSSQVDQSVKITLGKLAYYLKGLEQLGDFTPLNIYVATGDTEINDEFILFLILNSCGAGGFHSLCDKAEINDGMFDFIAIRNAPMVDLLMLFIKMLKGEHLDDEHVVYLKGDNFRIRTDRELAIDIDGETGPQIQPDTVITIHNLRNAIRLCVPRDFLA